MTKEGQLIESYAEKIRATKAEVAKALVGQEEMIQQMISTLFSRGRPSE